MTRFILSVVVYAALFAAVVTADEGRTVLFGDWEGARSRLEDQGVSIESVLTTELVSNTSGGVKTGSKVLGNYDLTLTVDTTKAKLWDDGTFFIYFLGDAGGDPSTYVGDSQVSSNIEAYDTFKLYEAWYDHAFFDGMASVLVGLHDLNSEFNSLEYASTLFNSSFGIERDISQVGPSIFSTTSLAARLKVLPNDGSYIQTALYDGVPGDPNNPRGTHIKLERDDGLFWATELGLNSSEEDKDYYKIGLGGWYQSTDFEDFAGNARSSNGGLYLIGESSLIHEDDPAQGLGAFFQIGFARSDRNQVGNYFGAGLSYTGLVPSRDEDITVFGLASARNSDDFLETNSDLDRTETALELTHRLNLLPYLAVQPDLQYIINPGTAPELDNALVMALRVEVAM